VGNAKEENGLGIRRLSRERYRGGNNDKNNTGRYALGGTQKTTRKFYE